VKIVIPDDYQDIADKVAAYSLIRQHDVTRYTDSNHDLDTLVERLKDGDVVVSIRERVPFTRALLERLPKLRLISLLGRGCSGDGPTGVDQLPASAVADLDPAGAVGEVQRR